MVFSIRTIGSAAGALAILGVASAPAPACEFMRTADQNMTPVAAVQTTIGTAATTPTPARKPDQTEPSKTAVTEAEPAKPASVEADTGKVDIAKAAQTKSE